MIGVKTMMQPKVVVDNYLALIESRTPLSPEQKQEIKDTLGFLVEEIFKQVLLIQIVATDSLNKPVTQVSVS